MAQTLADIMAGLNGQYDPQRALIQKQQAALPTEEQAALAGLDTAKQNAFGDIVNSANSRGMAYSGAPVAEQYRYVGEKYLPDVAGLKSDYGNRKSKLEAALLDINQQQGQRAQQMHDTQVAQDLEGQRMADARVASARTASAAQGLNLGNIFNKPTPAPASQPSIDPHSQLMSDIQHFIGADWSQRYLPGFTERTLIPTLQREYPDIAAEVPNMVYQWRKQFEGKR